MKVLFIGGTGTISMAITRQLLREGHTVYLVNRGNRNENLTGDVHFVTCDINRDTAPVEALLEKERFDAAANFIVFNAEQAKRDIALFSGRVPQYIVLSTCVTYTKPVVRYPIRETDGQFNNLSDYGFNKIKMEEVFWAAYRETGFPVTVVRPSHTYDERQPVVQLHGEFGAYQTLLRMRQGKPIVVAGDGTSLWTATHNKDFARAYIGLIGNPKAIGEGFTLTSEETVTWNRIYEILAKACGGVFKPCYIPSDIISMTKKTAHDELLGDKSNSLFFDNAKLREAVPGFRCEISVEEGLTDTVKHLLATPSLCTEDPAFDDWSDRMVAYRQRSVELLDEYFPNGMEI